MRSRLVLGFGLLASLFASAQLAACGSTTQGAGPVDGGSLDAGGSDALVVADTAIEVPDAANTVCKLSAAGNTSDPVFLCLQKRIVTAEHALFSATTGMPSSWSADTGKPDSDGGAPLHDLKDDIAYGGALGTYAISAQEYGDTDLTPILTSDLAALSSLLSTELATLPASYDGTLYFRLRRAAQGLRLLNLASDGDKIDALAEAYGRAIYSTYFHQVTPAPVADAGVDAGDAGDDGGSDASATTDSGTGGDDGGDAGDAGPTLPPGDGILGVASASGGFAYDVDQAAAGALALVELAGRHESDDAVDAHKWARAAAEVFTHLYTRARDASGLYYTDLVTSADPGHDALATGAGAPIALLADTQASVVASYLRARDTAAALNVPDLSQYPFNAEAADIFTAMQGGSSSLWDLTSTAATTNACAQVTPALPSCGSGLYSRFVLGQGVDTSFKTLRSNALFFAAIHRGVIAPATKDAIDIEPLRALFTDEISGANVSFVSQVFNQASYLPVLTGKLDFPAGGRSYSTQANSYAIEVLTEQWVGLTGAPSAFY